MATEARAKMTPDESNQAATEYEFSQKTEREAAIEIAVEEAHQEMVDLKKRLETTAREMTVDGRMKKTGGLALYKRIETQYQSALARWENLQKRAGGVEIKKAFESVDRHGIKEDLKTADKLLKGTGTWVEKKSATGREDYAASLRGDSCYQTELSDLRESRDGKVSKFVSLTEHLADLRKRAFDKAVAEDDRLAYQTLLYDLGELKLEEADLFDGKEMQKHFSPVLVGELSRNASEYSAKLGQPVVTYKGGVVRRRVPAVHAVEELTKEQEAPAVVQEAVKAVPETEQPKPATVAEKGAGTEVDALQAAMDKASAEIKENKPKTVAPILAEVPVVTSSSPTVVNRHEARAARLAARRAEQEASKKPTTTAAKQPKEERPADTFKNARAAADITLGLVEPYTELHPLHADTEQVGHEKFSEATRRLWADLLTLHGKEKIKYVKEGGERKREIVVKAETDVDGRAVLGILRLAGIDTSHASYVLPGDAKAGRINIDTSNNDGIGQTTLPTGESYFFIDHHGSKSDSKTSASAHLFHSFTDLGLLPPKEWQVQAGDSAEVKAEKEKKQADLRELVDFVTTVDNLGYPEQGKLFPQSDRTLVGLRYLRQMTFEKMLEIISAGKKPTDILTDEELTKFGLAEASGFQKKVIKDAKEYLDFLQVDGRILPSRTYGKVILDINGKLPAGPDAAASIDGVGAYILWDQGQNSFVIYTLNQNKLASNFRLNQGMRVREGMWIKPRRVGGEKLTVKIRAVLRSLGCEGKLNSRELFDQKKRWEQYQKQKSATVDAAPEDVIAEPDIVGEGARFGEPPPELESVLQEPQEPEVSSAKPPPIPADVTSDQVKPIRIEELQGSDAEKETDLRNLKSMLEEKMFDQIKQLLERDTKHLLNRETLINVFFGILVESNYNEEAKALLGGEEEIKRKIGEFWDTRHPDTVPSGESAPTSAASMKEPRDVTIPEEFEPMIVSNTPPRVEAPEAPVEVDIEPVLQTPERDLSTLEKTLSALQVFVREQLAQGLMSDVENEQNLSALVNNRIEAITERLKSDAVLNNRLMDFIDSDELNDDVLDNEILMEFSNDPLFRDQAEFLFRVKLEEFKRSKSNVSFVNATDFIASFADFYKNENPDFFKAVKDLKKAGVLAPEIIVSNVYNNWIEKNTSIPDDAEVDEIPRVMVPPRNP